MQPNNPQKLQQRQKNGRNTMSKKFFFTFFIISTITALILISGCTKPRPYGGDYEIRVLADSVIWNETEGIIRQTFERVEPTPQPEKLFTVIKQEPKTYKRYKNLLFLSTLEANDELSQIVNSSLSEAALAKVKEGEIMFTQEAVWAQHQKIAFLIAPDIPTLKNEIENRKEDIFFQFDNYWREFHKNILFSMNEQIDVEKHLLRNYGWMINIPIDYKLETQSAKDRFVMFHRKVPLRWVSVFWEEATDPSVISKEYCIKKRNQWADSFYENEIVDEKFEPVVAEEVYFLNRRALKLRGLWGNTEKSAGGPFRMYCFFDEAQERIYFIDMHLFAPDLKKKKMHYLRQMDILANTFKTNLEVKAEDL